MRSSASIAESLAIANGAVGRGVHRYSRGERGHEIGGARWGHSTWHHAPFCAAERAIASQADTPLATSSSGIG